MELVNLYEYNELERVTNEETGIRYYVTPSGERMYSVTTILSETGDTSGLDAWKEWVGEKESTRIVNEACALGSLMHENLENFIQGNEMKNGGNLIRRMARNMANQIIEKGLSKVTKVYGIEKMLYSELCYAGTADLVIEYNGKLTIGDFKTARKMKSKDQIENYFCQIAAYAMAHDEMFGTNIEQGVIFMVDRDGNFKEFFFEGLELEGYKRKWLDRLETFLEKQSEG